MRAFDVEIPSPCDADWAQMRPEHRARFCSACQTRVHDLSAMTQREAQRFLARTEGQDVCLSFLRDAAGAIQYRPAAPRLVPVTRLLRRAAPAAGLALAMAACTPVNPAPRVAPTSTAASDAGPAPTAAPLAQNPPAPEAIVGLDEPCDEVPAGPPTQADPGGGDSEASAPPEPAKREVRPLVRTAGKPMVRVKDRATPSRP